MAEYWEDDEDIKDDFGELSPSQLTPSSPQDREVNTIVWWIVAFISLFQTLHVIPDKAIAWLIKFISMLLNYCGQFSIKMQSVANAVPQSLYLRNKYLFHLNSEDFCKYVVCPSCHCLYHLKDLYEERGTRTILKTCLSHEPGSNRCNSDLIRKVYTRSRHLKLYPLKVFCYGNLKASLQQLLLRSGFAIACESTRNLCCETSGKLSDLYQGQMWKDFLNIDGVDFMSAPYCYGLMLNIDWFPLMVVSMQWVFCIL